MTAIAWTRPAASLAGMSGAARRRYWRQSAVAYLYLSPALILLTLFHFFPAIFGLFNGVMDMAGRPPSLWLNESAGVFKLWLGPLGERLPEWLGGPSLALVGIAAMSVWSYIGFYVVIYLAGLGNISKELYEAARM